jgi:hypothetical protein
VRYEGGWDRKDRMGERGWYKEHGKRKRGREEGREEERTGKQRKGGGKKVEERG